MLSSSSAGGLETSYKTKDSNTTLAGASVPSPTFRRCWKCRLTFVEMGRCLAAGGQGRRRGATRARCAREARERERERSIERERETRERERDKRERERARERERSRERGIGMYTRNVRRDTY